MYPQPLLRHQADVDFVAPDERALWQAARQMGADGWECQSMWVRLDVTPAARSRAVTLVLVRRVEGANSSDRVEITTDPLEGDHWRMPSRPLDDSNVDSATLALLFLVEEGVCRVFGARDVFDAVMLLSAVGTTGRIGTAASLIRKYGLVAEWQRLATLISGLDETTDSWCRALAAEQRESKDGRGLVGVPHYCRYLRNPVAFAALAAAHRLRAADVMVGSPRWTAGVTNRGLTLLQRIAGPRYLLSSGVALFGRAIDTAPHEDDRVSLRFRSPLGLAHTPLGTFALSAGGDIPGEWLESAIGREGAE